MVEQVAGLEQRRIDLLGELDGVAAVGEDRGAGLQHDGEAGRAGEAGEPAQAFAAGRHVFALVLVGARHQPAVEPEGGKPFAQPRQPLAAGMGSLASSKLWNMISSTSSQGVSAGHAGF
jgi:hypothetical protein